MNRIMVFIKNSYMRDAQAKLEASSSNNWDDGCEEGWKDVNGPVLIYDRTGVTREQAKEQLVLSYPEADPRIFEFVEFNETTNRSCAYNHMENLIEIVKAFEALPPHEKISKMDSKECNQMFISWANEFSNI